YVVELRFFFQAEDGIRDFDVTGVQTCALPIWLVAPLLLGSIAVEPPEEPGDEPEWRNGAFLAEPGRGVATEYYAKRHLVPFGERSEERRGGEVGRTGSGQFVGAG